MIKIYLIKFTLSAALLLSCGVALPQELEKSWSFSEITDAEEAPLFDIKPDRDSIHFADSRFHYHLTAKDDLVASGNYIHQGKLLVLFYDRPTDTIRKYQIAELTDATLVLEENDVYYRFVEKVPPAAELVPSRGLTVAGLFRGALGMTALLLIAWLLSANRKKIRWKTVGIGLATQLALAIGILKVPLVQKLFEVVGKVFVETLNFTREGSIFLLGDLMDADSYGFIFLFQVLPTLVFFSALTSLLFYLGVIQVVVKGMARILTKLMKISGAESLSVVGNIFLGQTESPLMIKAYLEKMTRSEILLVMVGGMATVAGGVLAAYISFLGGTDPEMELLFARHLLAASVMAAPGAVVIAKILYPQTKTIVEKADVSKERIGANVLDAIANGTGEGLRLAANVGAMLLVFLALIAMLNFGLEKAGSMGGLNGLIAASTPYEALSLEFLLGYIFAPLMWVIGVAQEDMALMGQLLGIKLVATEFVGYIQLADLKTTAQAIHLTYNKSVIMATYMLCGFANFASIGIQIGGIGSLAPGQRKTLSEFGLRALVGGTLASLLSATIAGMIVG